jgi:hypothetical protein
MLVTANSEHSERANEVRSALARSEDKYANSERSEHEHMDDRANYSERRE